MTTKNYHYQDFYNLESILTDKALTENLVSAYQNIFSEPGLWGENYTEYEVLDNLYHQLSGKAGIRLCIDQADNNKLIGFFWAQLLGYRDVEKNIKKIQYYQLLGSPNLKRTLKSIIGNEPIIYLHDLGVSNLHRGHVSLQKLIYPVLESLVQRTKIKRVLFWSISGTRVYRLAERADFKWVAEIEGMQFFIGDFEDNATEENTETKSASLSAKQQLVCA